jgi:hypothetical protein
MAAQIDKIIITLGRYPSSTSILHTLRTATHIYEPSLGPNLHHGSNGSTFTIVGCIKTVLTRNFHGTDWREGNKK